MNSMRELPVRLVRMGVEKNAAQTSWLNSCNRQLRTLDVHIARYRHRTVLPL